jgi:hypothetical protein
MSSLRQNFKASQIYEAGYGLAVGFTAQYAMRSLAAAGALARSRE